MQRSLSLLIIVFFLFSARAQFYNTGTAPASVRWKQIRTENFQVIFPAGFYREANRTANILEFVYEKVSAGYDLPPRKISVLLYNTSLESNAYVAWAPRRMEWVTTPPQEMYAQDWLEQLAIHELRHVVQLSNLDQGITRILKIFFGEAASGAVAGYLPFWFIEGDAVVTETILSSTGRGRDPGFDMELRAIELDKEKRFSYDQSYLGSYRYFTPNHYQYGYQMVSYGRITFGEELWKNTINKTAKFPIVAPFYLGLHKQTGLSKKDLYTKTFDSLKYIWNNTLDTSISIKKSNIYLCSTASYINYKYVQPIPGGLFGVRTGIDDIARFVILTDSSERIIHTPGIYYGTRVHAGKKHIVWEEYIPDTRWEQQNYTRIIMMDIATGEKSILEKKGRLFSPVLSPSEDRVACIGTDLRNRYKLVILDIASGEKSDEILPDSVLQAAGPVWLNEHEIAYVALGSSGKRIESRDLVSGETKCLFFSGYKNIENLTFSGGRIFFTLDREAIRNIYALDIRLGESQQVTHVRHGADFPCVDEDKNLLYFSEYTLGGYRPCSKTLDPEDWTDISKAEAYQYPWAEELAGRTDFNIQESEIPAREYGHTDYHRLTHSLNLHSWLPFYFDPDDPYSFTEAIYPGVTLLSQNKLSTVTGSISYSYDYKEGDHHLEPRISLHGFYPVFDLSMSLSSREGFYYWPDTIPPPANKTHDISLSLRSYLPLNLTRDKWYRFIQPELTFRYYHRYYYLRGAPGLGLGYLEAGLYFHNLLKQSTRDIQPRFGQAIYAACNLPFENPALFSGIILGTYTQYLPGIGRHHGIKINIAYEEREETKYPILNNRISLPRGYDQDLYYFRNIKGIFEYTLPLYYPDWSIGPLVYIKRIHLILHADAARIRYGDRVNNQYSILDEPFYSCGVILASEMHFLRFFMPFTPTMRISFLPETRNFDFGFGISIDTSGL